MVKLSVQTPEGAYPIFVGAASLTALPHDLPGGICALVTNPTIAALHAPRVIAALRARGFTPTVIEIPEGEKFKTLATVSAVYDQLVDARLDRTSIIFALGGGVVGDLAGLVAATYLRGVPFVQLPTTLLAMVDASIGGKVAVDHPRGKNLIGAFKQPLAIVADTDTLATLPEAELRSGMAEVVKHGVIANAGLFEQIEIGNWKMDLADWLPRAMQVKVDIVSRDPFERGERAKLNLGHTFGHALEKLAHYEMRHGDAVAIGVVCAARLAARRGVCAPELIARLENVLRGIGLPTRVPRDLPAEAILAAMQTDKKRAHGRGAFILPRALGEVVIVDDVPREEIVATLEETR